MKHTLLPLAFLGLFSCATEREVQMYMVDAELERIDTIQRYPNVEQKLLTWRASDQVRYYTYEPMTERFSVGERVRVLMRK
jgi:hypothetical protein